MLNFLGVEPCFIIDGGVLLSSANHKKKDHNLKVMALILIRQLMFKQIASI